MFSGDGAAVLIRALDPVDGLEPMQRLRLANKKSANKTIKEKDIGNGPSKLTQALSINKAIFNQKDIATCESLWLEDSEMVDDENIVTCARIGIDYAGDWAKKPLRFYVLGNKSVSVRDKNAEAALGHTSRLIFLFVYFIDYTYSI